MKPRDWVDLSNFINIIANIQNQIGSDFLLFRGQPCSKPLLPKIARDSPKVDTTPIERRMLDKLRRQGQRFPEVKDANDLDLLAIAQHHGMATRLLDWSSNPLVALWFACIEPTTLESAHLYMYRGGNSDILDPAVDIDPFSFLISKLLQLNQLFETKWRILQSNYPIRKYHGY